MFTEKTPLNIQEIVIKSSDKNNYKERLKAIEELGKWKCLQSTKRLYSLMRNDKIYSVKQRAFIKLQSFGEQVKLPKKGKGHLIKDINKKLLKIYNLFEADEYTLEDFKVKFKEKYPEQYDIYLYEKGIKFNQWIKSVVEHSSMKKLKNSYIVKIHLNNSEIEEPIYSGGISYKGATNSLDKIVITNKLITIDSKRSAIINPKKILDNDSNTIHIQIIKSLLFYYLYVGKYVAINSIKITREKNEIIEEFTLPNNGTPIIQVLNSSFLINTQINFNIENLKDLFENNEKALTLYNSISYILKANVAKESSDKFEKLWKSFNSIYRYLGNGESENKCQRIIRSIIINNETNFQLSKNKITQLDKVILREKIRFRDLILNDYKTKNLTVTFIAFIYRYSDHRISDILKDTLVYREKFIKDISSIENVERKFSKFEHITHIYQNCKNNSSENCIYNSVIEHLENNINNTTTSDIEVVLFICIKYAYYIRNQIFHAEKHDLSFKFTKNKLTDELDWLNDILETLILELISNNNLWEVSE